MNDVTVSKLVLLSRLKENLKRHREIFEDALVGYRSAVIKVLDERLQDAKAGRRINQIIGLIEPQDHTKDYESVIDMVELSVDDTITLPEHDFRAYVRDEWAWKQQFVGSTAMYNSKAF